MEGREHEAKNNPITQAKAIIIKRLFISYILLNWSGKGIKFLNVKCGMLNFLSFRVIANKAKQPRYLAQ